MRLIYFFFLAACYHLGNVYSARILAVFPVCSYSHYIIGHRLLAALALRGHEVTFVSPYKQKSTLENFRDVPLTGLLEQHKGFEESMDLFKFSTQSAYTKYSSVYAMGIALTEQTMQHNSFQEILKSNSSFDLIITEPFIVDALRALGHKYKASTILLSTFGSSVMSNFIVGNPSPLASIPDACADYSGPMDFYQRLQNVFINTVHTLIRYFFVDPEQNRLIEKYFPDAPPLNQLRTDLILLNSHPAVTAPVPHVSNMIEIGGFHINPLKKMPEFLKEYLDSSTQGAIYFSLGSIAKSKSLTNSTRNIFLNVFQKLQLNVLWKYEGDDYLHTPDNVLTYKWIPQQEVLAHPNVKLFITHGGLLSLYESIYHGKPIVGIPIFAEQPMNVKQAEVAGFGLSVPFTALTEDRLYTAIKQVLSNNSFEKSAQKRSQILRDRPVKPLDLAIYWTEYVLKHGGQHLQTQSLHLNWFQDNLVDVMLFICVCIILSIMVIIFVLKFLFVLTRSKKPLMMIEKKDK